MSEVIRDFVNNLRSSLIGTIAAGTTVIVDNQLFTSMAQYHKAMGKLRHFREGLMPIVYSLIAGSLRLPGAYESVSIGLFKELEALYREMVIKEPFCYAPSSTQIECWNLDPNVPIGLIVDGTSTVAPAQNVLTDSAGHVVITLSTALSPGKHEILVQGRAKGFHGYIVV